MGMMGHSFETVESAAFRHGMSRLGAASIS